jgi:hypothetical protein
VVVCEDTDYVAPKFLSGFFKDSRHWKIPSPPVVTVRLVNGRGSAEYVVTGVRTSGVPGDHTVLMIPTGDGPLFSFKACIRDPKGVVVGDHVGVVMAKPEAKQRFEAAVKAGASAAMGHTDEKSPDIVTVTIGGVPVGSSCTVTFATAFEADMVTPGVCKVVIPTSIAPRFGASQDWLGLMKTMPCGVRVSVDMQFTDPDNAVQDVRIPPHLGALTRGPQMGAGNKSFVVDFKSEGVVGNIELAAVLKAPLRPALLTHVDRTGKRSFVITLNLGGGAGGGGGGAPSDDPLALPVFHFIVDVSGSMQGGMDSKKPVGEGNPQRLAAAKRAVKAALRTVVPDGAMFQVTSFHVCAEEAFREGPVPKTLFNVEAACRFVDALTADGGTYLNSCLKTVLTSMAGPKTCVVLSDGEVYDVEKVVTTAYRGFSETGSTVSVFSIGTEPSVALATRVPAVSGGTSASLTCADASEVMTSFMDFVRGVLTPAATNLKLSVCLKDPSGKAPCPQFVVEDDMTWCPAAVYAGRPTAVLVHDVPEQFSEVTSVMVSGTWGLTDARWFYLVPAPLLEATKSTAESECSHLVCLGHVIRAEALRGDDSPQSIRRIVDLSVRHQVLTGSKHVAFLATEALFMTGELLTAAADEVDMGGRDVSDSGSDSDSDRSEVRGCRGRGTGVRGGGSNADSDGDSTPLDECAAVTGRHPALTRRGGAAVTDGSSDEDEGSSDEDDGSGGGGGMKPRQDEGADDLDADIVLPGAKGGGGSAGAGCGRVGDAAPVPATASDPRDQDPSAEMLATITALMGLVCKRTGGWAHADVKAKLPLLVMGVDEVEGATEKDVLTTLAVIKYLVDTDVYYRHMWRGHVNAAIMWLHRVRGVVEALGLAVPGLV